MAQADRMIGSLRVFSIGELSVFDQAKEASIELYRDTAENMAIKDLWHYPQSIGRGARISGTFAAEKDSDSSGLLAIGNVVNVVFQSGDNVQDKCVKVTGQFVVTRTSFRESREGVDLQVELESQGPVVVTAAPIS